MQSIILVDDEDHFRSRLARAFVKRGYTVYQAANADEALRKIKEHQYCYLGKLLLTRCWDVVI